ncbi:hypothetical protein SAMN05444287_0737 [Octadecabacter temperatus]|uniref:Uncharacterized protein n=1 Tax=Octadecabacter temperatus TaxID=1458307 RepID=A0A0K0Y3X3_9RHOB|nr:DUF6157 family protein [Octadecabacter temperatus]AKS45639.1 hypothetical protein OSB_10830 [Octadecabacter temperatus]SIN97377.1 hypothetical protein SAMN05444287_0737 [Octadecabacter temperatus]
MKVHSTNYTNVLITPSEDSKAAFSMMPSTSGTIGAVQFDMLQASPYTLTGDDLLIAVLATRKSIPQEEWADLRAEIFSKGQPCTRVSPLVKTMGWALHHDANSRIAMIDVGTKEYAALNADDNVRKIHGMRNKRR